MERSPDGKAYLVATARRTVRIAALLSDSWITGDEVYLLRVTPSIENIKRRLEIRVLRRGATKRGAAVWSKNFAKIKPIAAWRGNMGCVTVTYHAPLKTFLMCVTDGGDTWAISNPISWNRAG